MVIHYMIFTRSKTKFTTRLTINKESLEKISVTKLLGLWISEDLSWSKNCKEICRKAYSRMSMITKLKYVGVNIQDLLEIYILFIRSIAEYCAVAFHSSLTKEESHKIENIQKTSLKIILGVMYIDYPSALEMTGLETLADRREARCLSFAKKAVKHPRMRKIFPFNSLQSSHYTRDREIFYVNFARTEEYRKSAIPYCQRLLNKCYDRNYNTVNDNLELDVSRYFQNK